MNSIVRWLLVSGVITAVSLHPADTRAEGTGAGSLQFATEFRIGKDVAQVDVTFYGTMPAVGQAEAVVRKCLEAAAALHPGNDIAGRAWHAEAVGDAHREAVALSSGESLLLAATDGTIRWPDGGELDAKQAAASDGDASWLTDNADVTDVCKNSSPDHVAMLVKVALEHQEEERKLIVKAMRAACKEQGVPTDRKLSTCLSTISKVVEAERPAVTAGLPADLPEAIERGKTVFTTAQCDRCHTSDGRGGPRGPNLTDKRWIHCDGSLEGIRKVLESGVPRGKISNPDFPFAMAPATDSISDEKQLADLAVYVHSLRQN